MRFTELLLIGTLITGLIWLLDVLFFRHKRTMHLVSKQDEKIKDPWVVEYSKAFFPILLIVLVVRLFIAEPFRIPSGSMHPTLLEGDFIIVNRYQYGLRLPVTGYKILSVGEPKRGEVVVFKHVKNGESIDMIKRIVGLPGDKIQYKDKIIYLNGQPLKQEFKDAEIDKDGNGASTWPVHRLREKLDGIIHDIFVHSEPSHMMSEPKPFEDVTVPPNSYFVMGDNRDNSIDSRFWGFVSDKDILGRAFGVWMSWDSAQTGGLVNCVKHCVRWDRIGNHLGETEKSHE